MDVSLVIPMHDEREALVDLLPALVEFQRANASRLGLELIMVDDGSHDGTFDICWQWSEGVHFPTKVLRLNPQEGIGGALRNGFDFCSGRWVVTYDADMSYPLDDLPKLIEAGEAADAGVVTATPYSAAGDVKDVQAGRLGISKWATRLYGWRLGSKGRHLSCFTCGFRAYRRDALARLGPKHDGFLATAELLVRALRLGDKVIEVPSVLGPRTRGRSKMKVLRTTLSHLKFLVALR